MSDTLKRLKRLLRAQAAFVKASEVRLVRADRKVADISAALDELGALSDRQGELLPAGLPPLLRALVKADDDLKEALSQAEQERRRLLAAKTREKCFAVREKQIGDAEARRAGMEQALESSLAMIRKASGKRDVIT